jgi:DNA-binding IscR family transcriptional regulator
MPASTRFAVATHLLALIAADKPHAVTSETLAASLGANPAAVRRLLGRLAAAGITKARLGKGGGAVLARPAKKISLAEIYCAVEGGDLVARGKAPPAGGEAGRRIADAFEAAAAGAERAFLETLAAINFKSFVKAAMPAASG